MSLVWQLLNNTPFAAARGFLRDRTGAETWIGVLRASFDVGPRGELKRANRQAAPLRAAEWQGSPGLSSLKDDLDFVLGRQGTDVLVQAQAHAPGGRPAHFVDVGLRGPGLDKRVRVHGPRVWTQERAGGPIVPSAAEPFQQLAFGYEHAFGGIDQRAPEGAPDRCASNPVGSGFCHEPRRLLGQPAPRLEHPGVPIAAGVEQAAPPGYSPIAPNWQPRSRLAGTYDEAWRARRAPLLPADYQDEFCRAAPRDQQLSTFLRGGEFFELRHMTPESVFDVRLPELEVTLVTSFASGSECNIATLQTVRIYPGARRLELAWQAAVPCQGREHTLQRATLHCKGERACRLP